MTGRRITGALGRRTTTPFLARCADASIRAARSPLAFLGVDVQRMRAIVATKLTLDARGRAEGGMGNVGLTLFMALAWLSSLPIGLAAVAKLSPDLWMALVAGHTLVLLGFLLFSQLAPILVDTTDVQIVGSRPVDDRTLFAARLTHLAAYAISIALPSTFWPVLLGWLGHPFLLVLLVVPIAVALSAANAIGLAALLFAVTAKIAGPARFQRAASWAQVSGAVLALCGVQVLVRVLPFDLLRQVYESGTLWRFLALPLQQGSLFAVVDGHLERVHVVGAVLAFATPLVLLAIALAIASRSFAAALAGEVVRAPSRPRGFASSWLQRVGARLCRSHAERAGFDLGLALGRRDRAFLRVALPGSIGVLAPAIVNLFPHGGPVPGSLMRYLGLIPLYFLVIVPPSLLESSRLCDTPEGRWIYVASPLASYRDVTRGAIKALIVVLAVPIVLVLLALITLIGGPERLPDALFAAVFAFSLGLAWLPFFHVEVPFTRPLKLGEARWDSLPPMFALMGVGVCAFGVQTLVRLHWASYAGAAVVLAGFAVFAWRRLEQIREPEPIATSETAARGAR